ncbi:type II CRISPR-associated endonuclease Cas1 [Acetobacter aceti]|uniref:CRISPR-associated endonuclease Cas1 n=1 Tax=Acetobacter aceti TaxID=435 RepID=A0A6S6PHX3_ACEAC|nr:type II CRISPR-associated endonuclease Cas1 [Acetobacter aceti]BCI67378.1 CRISPR-associated endonuclease Cas1 [Acetobacter aceti]
MAWRCVHISRPARLCLKDSQLVVTQDENTITLPLEDLACVVLDTPQVNLSGALLSALAMSGIALIIPDDKHHPAGVVLPFHQHHLQAEVIGIQIAASKPLRKRLWQTLVVAKISNQAALLEEAGHQDASTLRNMIRRVTSGDPDNIEAQAARLYWSRLFPRFTRSNCADRRNGLLNYGYAILRAAIARACVASGLVPSLGLHHASRTNAFNLADDLIEPFRPCVDRMVRRTIPEHDPLSSVSVEERRFMTGILSETVLIGKERMTILAATESVATDTVKSLTHSSAALLRPPALSETTNIISISE